MTVAKHLTSMVVLVGAVALLGALPAGAADQIGLAKRNGVALASCSTGNTIATRSATFTTTVVQRPKSKTMAVRFSLMRADANASSAPRKVALAAWSKWTRSKPGRSALVVTRRIDGLTGPALYSVKVELRWFDKNGKVIGTSTLKSDPCSQPAYGPDLRIAGATGTPVPTAPPPDPNDPNPPVAGQSTVATFGPGSTVQLTIGNAGRDPSRPATVTITADGATIGTADVPAIAAGKSVTVSIGLTTCPSKASVFAAVRAAATDVEPSYSNNSGKIGVCAP